MKIVSTDALTKLIQLIKSTFISTTDTVETNGVNIYTKSEIDNIFGNIESTINTIRGV